MGGWGGDSATPGQKNRAAFVELGLARRKRFLLLLLLRSLVRDAALATGRRSDDGNSVSFTESVLLARLTEKSQWLSWLPSGSFYFFRTLFMTVLK